MKRELAQLENQEFDILVIGGGIHGAVISYELAEAGYKTAIIDKNDFSAATSANSFKIIHGGIRYLQEFDYKRMRESIFSRRYFLTNASNLVQTLPCLMPVLKKSKIKPFMYKIGLMVNDLISWDRNHGLNENQIIPPCKFLNNVDWLKLLPDLETKKYSGALFWHDAITFDSERLVLDFVEKMVNAGGVAANYVKALNMVGTKECVKGITARCEISKRQINIASKLVINCTGPWLYETVQNDYRKSSLSANQYALALNIVVDPPILSDRYAVGLEGKGGYQKSGSVMNKDKRLFFFVPWHGKTMIGTYYRQHDGSSKSTLIEPNDITAFIQDINSVYPKADIIPENVCFYHAGLVPITPLRTNSNGFTLKKNTDIIDHYTDGGPKGLISIDSTKYTTAAITAKSVLNYIAQKKMIGKNPSSKITSGEISKPTQTVQRHVFNRLPLKENEIIRFAKNEMAQTLGDVIFRRTNLAALENLDDELLNRIAKTMGKELDWNENKINQEIDSVRQFYQPLIKLKKKRN